MGVSKHQPRSNAVAERLLAAIILVAAFGGGCRAADIYASRGDDGAMRYATSRLDPTYVLTFRDDSPVPPQTGKSAMGGRESPAEVAQIRILIGQAALQYGVSAQLVEAVVAYESRFSAKAISAKGARGLMQMLPRTAQQYGITDSRELDNPEKNIDVGTHYLSDLLARYGGNVALALAAYNAGSGTIDRQGGRIPPYRETMLYVPAVLVNSNYGYH